MSEEIKIDDTKIEQDVNPTTEELQAQLKQALADAKKYKDANDKLSKSEAEIKRQLRAKQTAEEQKAEEEAEAQRIRDEELENTKKELNHMKAVSAYKEISDEKIVNNLIEAISDKDHVAIAQIIANERKRAVTEAEAQWLKDRPKLNVGQYSNMSVEQIMAIQNQDERLKAIAQNRGLFGGK